MVEAGEGRVHQEAGGVGGELNLDGHWLGLWARLISLKVHTCKVDVKHMT